MIKLLTEKTEEKFVEATVRFKRLFEAGDEATRCEFILIHTTK